jgi:hypothetical protein
MVERGQLGIYNHRYVLISVELESISNRELQMPISLDNHLCYMLSIILFTIWLPKYLLLNQLRWMLILKVLITDQ